jgi:tRNA modification GTPase
LGAIGIIRLSGTDALRICNQVWKGKDLEKQKTHTLHLGKIVNAQGRILDEVLVSLFIAPKSYTKENVVEVSCHGSPYILQEIIQVFLSKGARLAKPGEFTMRAFLNGGLDLSQAEAVADLIASDSEAAHTLAMNQMRGGFSDKIRALRKELIHFASMIELELDFGEEDVEFADRTELRKLVGEIKAHIKVLVDSFALGNVLKTGVNTVIAGRPNAGKSTLLNVLLNEERAIVSEIAGTTRDTIEEVLNIKGVQFRLIDTAGIREATDTIEAIGVKKTMEKVKSASLLVYLFDVTEVSLAEVHQDLNQLTKQETPYLVVCNKMDKLPIFEPNWLVDPDNPNIPDFLAGSPRATNRVGVGSDQIISMSAKNGQNVDWLKECLLRSVDIHRLNTDNAVVSNSRHFDALIKADESLSDVLNGMDNGITNDFVAMDIRRALSYLGEITGEITTDDLLEKIFRDFCIGK